jgi:hypothetical protein
MVATEDAMRADGASEENIAIRLSQMRNEDKVAARALMSPEEVQTLEARNMKRYGDPVGPTPQQLYEKYDYSWPRVIDAAYRTDPALNGILAQLGGP